MKRFVSALALVTLLAACEPPGASIHRWNEKLNPYMNAAGWTMVEDRESNRHLIQKNGVTIWSEPLICVRMCISSYHIPSELVVPAVTQFDKDYKAAQAAFVQDMSEKTGIRVTE
jgi:hypothetical protein